jgi:hypothetical protein
LRFPSGCISSHARTQSVAIHLRADVAAVNAMARGSQHSIPDEADTWRSRRKRCGAHGRKTPEGIKLTGQVDAASSQAIFDTDRVYFIRVTGSKMMVKSPGVIVPTTDATSVVEFELVKAD